MKNKSLLSTILIIGFACIGNVGNAQGPFPIGTIHPGDSIIIIYDVQINNPLVPPSTTQISNQGTVSGSNFANQVTDDPDTGPANDPTITLLNMFALPVTFTEFKAYQKLSNIEVAWRVTETGTYKYEVERSANGITFYKIGEVMATGGNGLLNYSFLDTNPLAGNNFYRLKVIEITPATKYTSIVKVWIGGTGSMVTMYPNPVADKVVNVEMKKLARGTYTFTLFNATGQRVFSKQIDHAGGSASELIVLPANITKGIYHVQVQGATMILNKTLLID